MEAVEEVAPSPPKDLSPAAAIAKGKRTKRHRSPYSPIPFTIATHPPTATADVAAGDFTTAHFNHHPASSEESTTTEEVDTARCLLLLSRGGHYNSPNTAAGAAATKAAAGSGAYTCKTCNRAFQSFQALGGHRASHKKPKNEKKSTLFSDEEDFPSPPSLSSSKNRITSHSLSLQLSNVSTTTFSATPKSSPPPRIHECSYCGAEFTSGQALGGHMRKHRGGGLNSRSVNIPVESLNITPEPSIEELELRRSKKARTGLSLDLNLPAPEDDKSLLEKKEAATELGLSTTTNPPLVDCHY